MVNQDKDEGKRLLAEKVAEAEKALQEAIKVSEEYGIPIDWDLAYGMGGTYVPASIEDSWYSSDDIGRWVSSSEQC